MHAVKEIQQFLPNLKFCGASKSIPRKVVKTWDIASRNERFKKETCCSRRLKKL